MEKNNIIKVLNAISMLDPINKAALCIQVNDAGINILMRAVTLGVVPTAKVLKLISTLSKKNQIHILIQLDNEHRNILMRAAYINPASAVLIINFLAPPFPIEDLNKITQEWDQQNPSPTRQERAIILRIIESRLNVEVMIKKEVPNTNNFDVFMSFIYIYLERIASKSERMDKFNSMIQPYIFTGSSQDGSTALMIAASEHPEIAPLILTAMNELTNAEQWRILSARNDAGKSVLEVTTDVALIQSIKDRMEQVKPAGDSINGPGKLSLFHQPPVITMGVYGAGVGSAPDTMSIKTRI